MDLFRTAYPTNIRTVSGTPTLKTDDVVLMCTTTSAAVVINLLSIPAGYWSTQWKLYIVDASGNAATNNITINAPAGFKVNGASSVTINVNNGSALVRIVSDTDFIATGNLSSGGGSASLPFIYARLDMTNPAVTYVASASGGAIRTVAEGTSIGNYNTVVSSGLTGFTAASGVFIVPTSGMYSIGGRMTTRISDSFMNETVNSAGQGWMNAAPPVFGFVSIGVFAGNFAAPKIICAEKQVVNNEISDINIECTTNLVQLTAGDRLNLKILNRTDRDIVGMASHANCTDAYIEYSIVKIA